MNIIIMIIEIYNKVLGTYNIIYILKSLDPALKYRTLRDGIVVVDFALVWNKHF